MSGVITWWLSEKVGPWMALTGAFFGVMFAMWYNREAFYTLITQRNAAASEGTLDLYLGALLGLILGAIGLTFAPVVLLILVCLSPLTLFGWWLWWYMRRQKRVQAIVGQLEGPPL